MNYIARFLTLCMCLTTLVSFISTPIFGAELGPKAPQSLSEEEQAMFDMITNLSEAEVTQLAQTIEEEIGKMPPEEQTRFWQDVDKEAERLAPKIESYVQKKPTPEAVTEEKEPVTPKKPTVPKKKEKRLQPEKKRELTDKISAAKQLIANLIRLTDTFLSVVQCIPEFEEEVQEWASEGKLQNWQSGLTCSFLRTQIQSFVQKLNLLIDRDAQGKFKHLESFTKEESLNNNLSQLERKLSQYIPQIKNVSLDEDLSPQSEKALQATVSAYAEALNVLHVTGGIDAVMAKYQTIAQELKKEEEVLRTQAFAEESRRPTPRPITMAGVPTEVEPTVVVPKYKKRPTPPAYRPTPTRPKTDLKRIPEEPGREPGAAPSPVAKPSAKRPEKKPTAAPEKKAVPKPTPKKVEVKKDKIADDYLKDLSKSLDSASITFEDGKFTRIGTHVMSPGPVNTDLAEILIPEAIRQMRRTSNAYRSLQLRIKRHQKGPMRAAYEKELKNVMKEYRSTLQQVSKQIGAIRNNEQNVQAEKAYAYLGGLRADQVDESVRKRLAKPASLYSLEELIRTVLS